LFVWIINDEGIKFCDTDQGVRGEGSVQLTSLHLTSSDQLIFRRTLFFFVYKATYLNEEVNRTKPFPSARVPCTGTWLKIGFIDTAKCPQFCRGSPLLYIDYFFSVTKVGFISKLKNLFYSLQTPHTLKIDKKTACLCPRGGV
jgi:hypothetical protein